MDKVIENFLDMRINAIENEIKDMIKRNGINIDSYSIEEIKKILDRVNYKIHIVDKEIGHMLNRTIIELRRNDILVDCREFKMYAEIKPITKGENI